MTTYTGNPGPGGSSNGNPPFDVSLFESSISLTLIKDPCTLPCGHTFSEEELQTWRGSTCPTCRAPYVKASLHVNIALRSLMESLVAEHDGQVRENPELFPKLRNVQFRTISESIRNKTLPTLEVSQAILELKAAMNFLPTQIPSAEALLELSKSFPEGATAASKHEFLFSLVCIMQKAEIPEPLRIAAKEAIIRIFEQNSNEFPPAVMEKILKGMFSLVNEEIISEKVCDEAFAVIFHFSQKPETKVFVLSHLQQTLHASHPKLRENAAVMLFSIFAKQVPEIRGPELSIFITCFASICQSSEFPKVAKQKALESLGAINQFPYPSLDPICKDLFDTLGKILASSFNVETCNKIASWILSLSERQDFSETKKFLLIPLLHMEEKLGIPLDYKEKAAESLRKIMSSLRSDRVVQEFARALSLRLSQNNLESKINNPLVSVLLSFDLEIESWLSLVSIKHLNKNLLLESLQKVHQKLLPLPSGSMYEAVGKTMEEIGPYIIPSVELNPITLEISKVFLQITLLLKLPLIKPGTSLWAHFESFVQDPAISNPLAVYILQYREQIMTQAISMPLIFSVICNENTKQEYKSELLHVFSDVIIEYITNEPGIRKKCLSSLIEIVISERFIKDFPNLTKKFSDFLLSLSLFKTEKKYILPQILSTIAKTRFCNPQFLENLLRLGQNVLEVIQEMDPIPEYLFEYAKILNEITNPLTRGSTPPLMDHSAELLIEMSSYLFLSQREFVLAALFQISSSEAISSSIRANAEDRCQKLGLSLVTFDIEESKMYQETQMKFPMIAQRYEEYIFQRTRAKDFIDANPHLSRASLEQLIQDMQTKKEYDFRFDKTFLDYCKVLEKVYIMEDNGILCKRQVELFTNLCDIYLAILDREVKKATKLVCSTLTLQRECELQKKQYSKKEKEIRAFLDKAKDFLRCFQDDSLDWFIMLRNPLQQIHDKQQSILEIRLTPPAPQPGAPISPPDPIPHAPAVAPVPIATNPQAPSSSTAATRGNGSNPTPGSVAMIPTSALPSATTTTTTTTGTSTALSLGTPQGYVPPPTSLPLSTATKANTTTAPSTATTGAPTSTSSTSNIPGRTGVSNPMPQRSPITGAQATAIAQPTQRPGAPISPPDPIPHAPAVAPVPIATNPQAPSSSTATTRGNGSNPTPGSVAMIPTSATTTTTTTTRTSTMLSLGTPQGYVPPPTSLPLSTATTANTTTAPYTSTATTGAPTSTSSTSNIPSRTGVSNPMPQRSPITGAQATAIAQPAQRPGAPSNPPYPVPHPLLAPIVINAPEPCTPNTTTRAPTSTSSTSNTLSQTGVSNPMPQRNLITGAPATAIAQPTQRPGAPSNSQPGTSYSVAEADINLLVECYFTRGKAAVLQTVGQLTERPRNAMLNILRGMGLDL